MVTLENGLQAPCGAEYILEGALYAWPYRHRFYEDAVAFGKAVGMSVMTTPNRLGYAKVVHATPFLYHTAAAE